MKKIAIQGIIGSYHHQVAKSYFGENINLVECLSFDELANVLQKGRADIAIMALENSIAGSIIPNYSIIHTYEFHIIGEYYIDIQHHLLALNNQKIEDITEVYSHSMALLQCKDFLRKYPHIKPVEASDTATEAKRINDEKLKGIAAIASKSAGEIYNLCSLAENVQSIKNNATRFVILSKDFNSDNGKEIDKASLRFVLEHQRGSLATILNVMSDCRLNLTKIQSLPIIEKPWKYAFFLDVTFHDYSDFEKAKKLLNIIAEEFKVLGEFKNTKTI